MSCIKILSVNAEGVRVAACAARISTTDGGAVALFDSALSRNDEQSEALLIGKVLKSGHSSVIEHIFFNIAVSASSIAEQFFIEFRLASFTVKSRRYVDFSRAGYYKPQNASQDFDAFTEGCFGAYHKLLGLGVNKEDARFLLPRCFLSEFYISVNARELLLIVSRMAASEELRLLRGQLLEQLKIVCPTVFAACGEEGVQTAKYTISKCADVELLAAPCNPQETLLKCGVEDIREMARTERPRVLEHLSYTFKAEASYAGLTHLTRHRMLSLSVSAFRGEYDNYLTPNFDGLPQTERETVRNLYKETFEKAAKCAQRGDDEYREYTTLCGHKTAVVVTMNARELLLFLKLRCCRRAQWEIREIANSVLSLCRNDFPLLFDGFGPSCYVTGKCPEGRLSCGKMAEVTESFRALPGAILC